MPTTTTPPTERQIAFVTDLATEYATCHGVDVAAQVTAWVTILDTYTGQARSQQIDAMITLRDRARTVARSRQVASAWVIPAGQIPVGHFAVDGPIAGVSNQPVVFFRVTERYGRLRINQIIGGRQAPFVSQRRHAQIVTAIESAGVQNAARRYASEIGRCYCCNTRLTDAESRRLGIGPDCRGGRSLRGNAFTAWVAQSRSNVRDERTHDGLGRRVVRHTEPVGPESGTCTVCDEPALGYDRNNSDVCYCDECAIDKNVRIRLFARNPRLVTA